MVFSILIFITHRVVTGRTIIVITIFGQPIILLMVAGMLVTTILSSRRFTILVLWVSRCQLIMRLQVLPQRVRILQHNQSSMLTVQIIGRLTKTTSVIISGQAAVRQLLSTSLLRAIATTVVVRWSASAATVSIGRRFRTTRATVATWSSTPACTR